MDLSRILQMVVNLVLRNLINRGVNAGIDYATRRGPSDAELTPEERDQAQANRDLARRSRKTLGMARRFWR